jgi:hypothetical protein
MQLPNPPHQTEADEFHAAGRDLFSDLVAGIPDVMDAPMQMHGLAMGMEMATRECDHLDFLRDRLKVLITTLAYAAVTERVRRDGKSPNLSGYTASEGGGFDG